MATYYWVGGSGTWDDVTTTNWAASSGGSGDAGVPTLDDNVVFDANSNSGTDPFTVTLSTAAYCQDLTVGSLDGTMTLAGSGEFYVTGDLTLPATNFSFTSTSVFFMYPLTKNTTITTNGNSLASLSSFTLIDDGQGYTLTLGDDLNISGEPAVGQSASFIMTNSPNLNLNNKILTTYNVDLTQLATLNTYRLIFGSTGKIVVTGINVRVWWDASIYETSRSWALASGSCNLEFNGTGGGVSNRVININQLVANSLGITNAMFNVKVTAGTDGVQFATSIGAPFVKNLDFTGFSGTLVTSGVISIYGDLTFSSGMTIPLSASSLNFRGNGQITTNGKTIGRPVNLTGASIQLQDAFTMTNTLTFTFNSGTLDLNNFTFTTGLFTQANDTATRVITFGTTGKIVLSRASIGTATLWNCPTITNFSYTGTSRVETSGAGSGTRNYYHGTSAGGTESNAISLYIKTTQPTVVILGHFKNLDFTGSSSNLTQNSLTQLSIYGNLTLSATLTGTVGTSVGTAGGFHFKGGSGVTQYITTNGNNIGCGYYAFEGAATYVLSDNITATAASSEVVCGVYVFNGIFDSNDKTISVNALLFSPSFGPSQMYLKSSSVTTRDHYFYTPSLYSGTLYPGTSTITITGNSQNIYFGGYNFNNVTVTASGNTTYRYGGNITNFTRTVTSTQTMTFEAGKTFTFGTFNCTGTSSFRLTIQSLTPGSSYTISKSNSTVVNLSYCTISDFFAGTASVWKALKSNGNVNNGNNYGIQFTPPQGKGLQFFS
jgi:hypothetical protein